MCVILICVHVFRTHYRRQKRWWSAYLLFYDRADQCPVFDGEFLLAPPLSLRPSLLPLSFTLSSSISSPLSPFSPPSLLLPLLLLSFPLSTPFLLLPLSFSPFTTPSSPLPLPLLPLFLLLTPSSPSSPSSPHQRHSRLPPPFQSQ